MTDLALGNRLDGICFAPLNKAALHVGGWQCNDAIGAAAGAAKLLRLPREAVRRAISIGAHTGGRAAGELRDLARESDAGKRL